MKRPLAIGLAALLAIALGAAGLAVRQVARTEAEKEKHADAAVGKIVKVYELDGAPAFDLAGAARVASWTACASELGAEEELATGEVVLAPGGSHEVRAAFAGVLGPGERDVALGAAVVAGEKLAVLAPLVTPETRFDLVLRQRQAESDREGARAELAAAEKDLARAEDLSKDGSLARRQLEEASSRCARARSTFGEAERRAEQLAQLASKPSFEEGAVSAPATGLLSQLGAARGARVQAGDLLFTVDARDAARARVDLPPGLAAREAPPPRIEVELAAGGAPRAAELASVDPRVKPGTLYVSALYRFTGDAPLPRAGEPLVARLPKGAAREAARVPASALVIRDADTWAYVHVKGDTFARRRVAILSRRGDSVLVASGVKPGEEVVTLGAAVLLAEELKPLIAVEGGPPEADDEKAH